MISYSSKRDSGIKNMVTSPLPFPANSCPGFSNDRLVKGQEEAFSMLNGRKLKRSVFKRASRSLPEEVAIATVGVSVGSHVLAVIISLWGSV